MRRLFDHDEFTGITTWFEPTDDGFALVREQDSGPIVELNKKKQSMGRSFYAGTKETPQEPDMWKLASIPLLVQFEWLQKYGIDDISSQEHWPRVQKLLNSSDYRYLKTADIYV